MNPSSSFHNYFHFSQEKLFVVVLLNGNIWLMAGTLLFPNLKIPMNGVFPHRWSHRKRDPSVHPACIKSHKWRAGAICSRWPLTQHHHKGHWKQLTPFTLSRNKQSPIQVRISSTISIQVIKTKFSKLGYLLKYLSSTEPHKHPIACWFL